MRRILYIINPIAGTRGKGLLQQTVESLTQQAGIPYHIFPSAANGDYTFLNAFITENGVTDVVIAGGDGTINAVLAGLRHLPVQFGIIPCGSGNGLALSAGIAKNVEKALAIIFNGRSALTDAFTINGAFACMLCGLGFDAQVAHDFAADPKRGLTTYVKQTVKNFFIAPAYTFNITVADKSFATDAFFISIANSNQFGNNFKIAPKASLHDGLLDVVIMTKQNKLGMLLHTIRQLGGFNQLQEVDLLNENSSLIYFQTPGIRIRNPGAAPLHIDGDPAATQPLLDIQLLPGAFSLLQP